MREIAVPEFAAVLLRQRMTGLGDDDLIFHNRDGGAYSQHNLRRTFREYLELAELADSGISFRWYRRTGATVLARAVSVDAASAFLGHTSTAITEGYYILQQTAEYLGVSERRVRDLIASGEIVGVRVGQRQWAADAASVVSWAAAHPRAGRRLTLESQWALICLLSNGRTDWISPLVAHRTRKRIDEWTPEHIADAVAPAIRGGWPPWIGPQTVKPHIRAFEQAISPDPGLRELGLEHIEDNRAFYYQELRWRWWHEHGVEYDDFWAAPDIPAGNKQSGRDS